MHCRNILSALRNRRNFFGKIRLNIFDKTNNVGNTAMEFKE